MVAMMIPLGITFSSVTGIVSSLAIHGSQWAIPLVVGAGVLVALGGPLAILLFRLRRLLRRGYGREDVLLALRRSFERRREEFLYEFGTETTMREKAFRAVGRLGLAIGVVGVVALAATGGQEVAGAAAISGLYIGTLASVFSGRWRRLRLAKGSAWTRLWSGAVGKKLVDIAGFRLGQRVVPADRPTELAIAMNAESIYAAFPKELRESIGDVPAVLHELEAHARLARARVEEIEASIAEAQHGRGAGLAGSASRQDALVSDLGAQRAAAETRLGELVAALENVRLDLLRLRAGGGSVEGITRDIAAARAIGEEADRLVAGAREVDLLLERRTKNA